MKEEEAKEFIRSELGKGANESEIIQTLMTQEKIGNNHPTSELVTDLVELVKKEIANANEDANNEKDTDLGKAKEKAGTKKSIIYEKWRVDGKTGEKIKKEKIASLSEAQAELLNASNMTCEKGYKIKYIKK
ncbi:MAG: hypothetical protein LBK94_13435 [Prevotellaceae bacterium]|jgi:hypothetical protein|nr:hypothetical protein [Prevotellaceae bacterium]